MTGARLYGAGLFASHRPSLQQLLEILAQPFYQLFYQKILLEQAKREQEMARIVMLQYHFTQRHPDKVVRNLFSPKPTQEPNPEKLSDCAQELWPRFFDAAENAFLKRQMAVEALLQLKTIQNNADLNKYDTYQKVIDAIHEANHVDLQVSSIMILMLRAGYTSRQFRVTQIELTVLIKQELAHRNTFDLFDMFKGVHSISLSQDEIIKAWESQLPTFVELHHEMMALQLSLPPLHVAYYSYHSLVVNAVTACEFAISRLQHLTYLLKIPASSQDIARATFSAMIYGNLTNLIWAMTEEMAKDMRLSLPVDFVQSSHVPPFERRMLNEAKQHQMRLVSAAAYSLQIIAEWAMNVGALKRVGDGFVAVDPIHLGQHEIELQNYYYAMEKAVRSREDACCAIRGVIEEVKAYYDPAHASDDKAKQRIRYAVEIANIVEGFTNDDFHDEIRQFLKSDPTDSAGVPKPLPPYLEHIKRSAQETVFHRFGQYRIAVFYRQQLRKKMGEGDSPCHAAWGRACMHAEIAYHAALLMSRLVYLRVKDTIIADAAIRGMERMKFADACIHEAYRKQQEVHDTMAKSETSTRPRSPRP